MKLSDTIKPAVGKFWLYSAAALAWSAVGVYLDFLAVGWLSEVSTIIRIILILCGFALAAAIYLVMFKRFADQNIARIQAMTGERVCFFAFQRWTSYPLVVIMMSMGIYLRVYSPIPKPYLSILYIGIGSSLIIASFRYFRQLGRRKYNYNSN
jgi:hypothetical protein